MYHARGATSSSTRPPGTSGRALLSRYGIDAAKGFPAVVLSDDKLRVAEATKEGELAAAAAKGKDAAREWILKRFQKKARRFAHLDIYGWRPTAKPMGPRGGEVQGARALFEILTEEAGRKAH